MKNDTTPDEMARDMWGVTHAEVQAYIAAKATLMSMDLVGGYVALAEANGAKVSDEIGAAMAYTFASMLGTLGADAFVGELGLLFPVDLEDDQRRFKARGHIMETINAARAVK